MNDRISKADKLEVLQNEKLKRKAGAGASTYLQQSLIDLNLEGGRYSNAGPSVIGRDPSAQYPAASSPWSAQADPGVEPPLNYSVNDLEPTGEAFEVAASIAEQELGEPETGAMAQSTDPSLRSHRKFPENASEVSGSPPSSQRRSVLSTPSALDATETARLTAEQHRVLSGHDLHSVASSSHSTNADLAENRRSSGLTPAAVPGLAVSPSAASPERRSRSSLSTPEVPDDGLQNVNRRSDRWPLGTSQSIKRRKI